MESSKVAVLDLGTNTFNLLLAKITGNAYYIFHDEKIPVKIGQGGINNGIITPEAQERALNALLHYKGIIQKEQISKSMDMPRVPSAMPEMERNSGIILSVKQRFPSVLSLVKPKQSIFIME